MEDQVRRIMADVLEVDPASLDLASSPDTVPGWDSIAHMELILAIEEELSVEFDEDAIPNLLTIAAICDAIRATTPHVIGKNIRHRWALFITTMKVAARFDVLIEPAVTIKYPDSLVLSGQTTLQSGSYIYGSRSGNVVALADQVVVGPGCVLLGEGGLTLGERVHLGPNVVITTQYGDSAATRDGDAVLKLRAVHIGPGSWIGSSAVIMPGARLGANCTVAPHSVVFGRWPDGTRLVGNPARRERMKPSSA